MVRSKRREMTKCPSRGNTAPTNEQAQNQYHRRKLQLVTTTTVRVEWLHQLKEKDATSRSLLHNAKMEAEGSGYA